LKKRYGQHFISDRNLLQRIIDLAHIAPGDTVIEIGPGTGTLTRELAFAAKQVIAIEIDRDLIGALRRGMPRNVEIVEGDALEVDLETISNVSGDSFHIVGNLPYNIATVLLRKFIAHRTRISEITVMLQKEVAERVRAVPGTHDYGPLSVLIQYYASPTWGFTVPPGAFSPPPKVDSAVIRLDWKPGIPEFPAFTDFVHRAFSSRRKKLLNNLGAILPGRTKEELAEILRSVGVSVDVRAETLSVEDFLRVYNRIL
jgi:16S rRNA (adenine1518-N6/adenine1519-N6)-dimethyltransferase